MAGSLGQFDVIVIGQTDVLLVQVKSNRNPLRAELVTIRDLDTPAKCRKVIHVWQDRQPMPDIREIRDIDQCEKQKPIMYRERSTFGEGSYQLWTENSLACRTHQKAKAVLPYQDDKRTVSNAICLAASVTPGLFHSSNNRLASSGGHMFEASRRNKIARSVPEIVCTLTFVSFRLLNSL